MIQSICVSVQNVQVWLPGQMSCDKEESSNAMSTHRLITEIKSAEHKTAQQKTSTSLQSDDDWEHFL